MLVPCIKWRYYRFHLCLNTSAVLVILICAHAILAVFSILIEIKGKLPLCLIKHHPTKTYACAKFINAVWRRVGSGGIAPCIFNRHWMEVSVHLHASTTFLLGKKPRYPLDSKLGGRQNRPRRLPTTGDQPRLSEPWSCRIVTELSWPRIDWCVPILRSAGGMNSSQNVFFSEGIITDGSRIIFLSSVFHLLSKQ
jgi:hypothetical protein